MSTPTDLITHLRKKIIDQMNDELYKLKRGGAPKPEVMEVIEKHKAQLAALNQQYANALNNQGVEALDDAMVYIQRLIEHEEQECNRSNYSDNEVLDLSMKIYRLVALNEAVSDFLMQVLEGRNDLLETSSLLADAALDYSKQVAKEATAMVG